MLGLHDGGAIRQGVEAPGGGAAEAGEVHPLVHVRTLVGPLCADAARSAQGCCRLLRAALVQVLYSFDSPAQLLDELHYNALYRWFVDLRDGERPWTVADYTAALEALGAQPAAAALFRRAVLDAHAYAALRPCRFRVDAVLVRHWSSLAPPAARPVLRLDRAHAVIQRRIDDPALDADALADELRMSRRALYLLFAKAGQTPSRAIRELRLDSCARRLRDPAHDHRKLTDLAYDHGFNDYATFSRLFRAQYGLTPRDFRRRHRGPQRLDA